MKIVKKGILPAADVASGADVATGPRRRADVARGSTAPLRHGAEATWQGACGPRGAQVALTRGRRPRGRSTWAPVWGATWRQEGVRMWRAHGLVGPGKLFGAVTQ